MVEARSTVTNIYYFYMSGADSISLSLNVISRTNHEMSIALEMGTTLYGLHTVSLTASIMYGN